MRSSTSHSKSHLPGLALGLLAVAILALVLSAWYSLRLNPEMRFFRHLCTVKLAWARAMDTNAVKAVFLGGSSCGTSIDPDRLQRQHNLPSVNFGLGASMGPLVLSRAGLSVTRPGDTLVVALEPELLAGAAEPTPFAAQVSLASGHPEWLEPLPDFPNHSLVRAAVALRPGGWHIFTLVGKVVMGRSLYRYATNEVHASGWHEVKSRMPVSPRGSLAEVSPDGHALLASLRQWAGSHSNSICYSLPVFYEQPAAAESRRKANARWLISVIEHMPVLKDPRLGVDTNQMHFADTALHPTRAGAHQRTDELAAQLKAQSFWTAAELERIAD
jgi:hypothetical protein